MTGPQFVTCAELRALLSQDKALVLDCRSEDAFADSRISVTANIVNIPKLYMGITSFSIGKELTGNAQTLYDRRDDFDKVLLVIQYIFHIDINCLDFRYANPFQQCCSTSWPRDFNYVHVCFAYTGGYCRLGRSRLPFSRCTCSMSVRSTMEVGISSGRNNLLLSEG